MELTYVHNPDWTLPHWVELEIPKGQEDLGRNMDISEWCATHCGPLGSQWGHDRQTIILPHPQGLNPVKVSLFYTKIRHSWRFADKGHATLFKLTFGGR